MLVLGNQTLQVSSTFAAATTCYPGSQCQLPSNITANSTSFAFLGQVSSVEDLEILAGTISLVRNLTYK
jgi:hypothetical protein